MSIESVLKIATNTHHILHPFVNGESSVRRGRYANWQMKGILLFAIATIFSLGITTCFLLVTAYLKDKRITQSQNETLPEQNVQGVARNAGLNANAHTNKPINVRENLGTILDDIIQRVGEITPLNSYGLAPRPFNLATPPILTVGLLVIKVGNGEGREVVKHSHLRFPQNTPNHPDFLFPARLEEVVKQAANEIEAHIHEKLIVEWHVLIKGHDDATTESFFCEAHGTMLNNPLLGDGNSSGKGQIAPQGARREFEQILTTMGCAHDLLQPFDFREPVENYPPAGLVF